MADERERQIRERVAASMLDNNPVITAEFVRAIRKACLPVLGGVDTELLSKAPDDLVYLLDALAAAREKNGRLREALPKYGRHLLSCTYRPADWIGNVRGYPCTCGWADVEAALARQDGA